MAAAGRRRRIALQLRALRARGRLGGRQRRRRLQTRLPQRPRPQRRSGPVSCSPQGSLTPVPAWPCVNRAHTACGFCSSPSRQAIHLLSKIEAHLKGHLKDPYADMPWMRVRGRIQPDGTRERRRRRLARAVGTLARGEAGVAGSRAAQPLQCKHSSMPPAPALAPPPSCVPLKTHTRPPPRAAPHPPSRAAPQG